MVRIIDAKTRVSSEGDEFVVLVLQGKIEPVISQTTGRPYLTARRSNIPCTFDIDTAKSLVGQTLQGDIERMDCDKYEFIIPSTGKKLTLTHAYRYNPEPASIEEVVG